MKTKVLLLFVLFAVGCQTMRSVQYIVPATRQQELMSRLVDVAYSHGLSDQTEQSLVPHTLVYYRLGDTSFTNLGARQHNTNIVVDLQFRSAGVGGREFRKLKPEIEGLLAELYGKEVKKIEDRAEQIPIMEKPQNQ